MYVLKQMYNGVYGYSNPLTDEQGKELTQKHKRGLDLFSDFPEGSEDNPDKSPKPKEDCGCGKKKEKRVRRKKEVVEDVKNEEVDTDNDAGRPNTDS